MYRYYLATAGASDKTITGKHLLSKKRKNFVTITFEGGNTFPKEVRWKIYDFLKENLL